jgi:uncharacterized damage-inducible protein DinB
MNKDDIELVFEYDRWANHRVLQAASALNAEEFTRDVGGSIRSVRDTLVHIVGGEWGWPRCWKEPSRHERRETSYLEISRGLAQSGIEKWTVDASGMTMTF